MHVRNEHSKHKQHVGTERANCFKCEYFALTWEPKTPRLCKLYGFKTTKMPSVLFYETTGSQCVGYRRKPGAE